MIKRVFGFGCDENGCGGILWNSTG